MDPEDINFLRMRGAENVKITTDFGSVILRLVKSLAAPHPKIIFIPYGPWANAIVSNETTSIGMPSFKGTPAEVESAPDKPVLTLKELLRSQFGR